MYNDEREVTANSILIALHKIKSKLPRWNEEKLNWAFLVVIYSHVQKSLKSPNQTIAATLKFLTEKYGIDKFNINDASKLTIFEQQAATILKRVSDSHLKSTLFFQIDRMIANMIRVNPMHCKIVATLIGEIFSERRINIIDIYPNTGEISSSRSHKLGGSSFPMLYGSAQPQKALLELKLRELELTAKFSGQKHIGLNSNSQNIYLIDAPENQPNVIDNSKIAPNRLGFFTIKDLATNGTHGTYIYISKSEGMTRSQRNADIRSLLKLDLTIQAQISFTSISYDNTVQKYTALFIRPDDITETNRFLNIDITNENRSLGGLDALERSILAGMIYNKWLGIRRSAWEPTPAPVSRIFDNLFEKGFKNVNGLCTSFDYDAKSDILFHLTQKKRPPSLRAGSSPSISTNPLPITTLLTAQQKRAVYVIGNNGAGKSLLLKEVAISLTGLGKPVVGISTSIHDRFPFENSKSLANFLYKGLKTSDRAMSMDKIEREASKSIINIFKNQALLDAFLSAMDCLEYQTNYFLAPNHPTTESRGDHLIPLSSSATENQEALKHIRTMGYQLGIVKNKDTHKITMFSELSSGEQSIIMLTTKIIDSHKPDTVYLLDEPENSLHVSWQQKLPKMLTRLSGELNCSFVIATHSPILITNSNTKSHCFSMNNGQLREIPYEDRQSVETILMEGFETYTPYNKRIQEQCAKLVASAIRAANEVPSTIEAIAPNSIRELQRLDEIIKLTGSKHADARQESDEQLISTAMAAILALAEKRAAHNA